MLNRLLSWSHTTLYGLVGIGGAVVVAAWLNGWDDLLSALPGAVTMKFMTAMLFIICSVGLAMRARSRDVAWTMAAALVLLVCGSLFAQFGTGTQFYAGNDSASYTVAPGQPSIGTLVAFGLVGLGLLDVFKASLLSAALLAVSLVALFGYLIGEPVLYYYWPRWSTGMAIHTATFFAMLGTGIWLEDRQCES